MVKLKLTPEEKNILITELAERMKDLVYMRAKDKAKEVTEKLLKTDLNPEDEIIINYRMEMVGTDILQIIGRIRRQEEKWNEATTTKKLEKWNEGELRRKKEEEKYEGELVRCNVCGHIYTIYPTIPPSDDTCPKCGSSDYTYVKENQQRDD